MIAASEPTSHLNTQAPVEGTVNASTSSTHPSTQPLPTTSHPRSQNEPNYLQTPPHHRILRHLAILGLLSFAAIWGTLVREGLVALNTFDGQPVFPLIWAQAFGCLIMGLAVGANKAAIEARYPPAYIMITTGFCGSVTTFSEWMLDVFRAFGDQKHYARGGLRNVLDALGQTWVTLAVSLVCISAGIALSGVLNLELFISAVPCSRRSKIQLPRTMDKTQEKMQGEKSSSIEPGQTLALDSSMTLLGLVLWTGSAILCGTYPPFRKVTFSLIVAPPGAILRWYLSRLNSNSFSKRHSLPLGTLAANLFATAIICAAFTASRAGSRPRSFAGGLTGCEALQGLEDGFCGCLSTVSTFAVELRGMRARKAVRYAVVSWVAGTLICVILVGAPWWSVGMDGRCLRYAL
nr:chromosome condensation [Melanopsichium pennsylvanicum 4]